ncbi:tetratricopeptide repeat-containing diguanylate cyclase [Massilia soli]|uniref:diguanylate cyclase n=1 Tax=Massilia soli TaxID=2792854 RepID=A0ABS7STG1_9BURK|nr:diguanylate cyclase [Massilia soli]MBZ2209238.1 diguanylate cyclase [Massilia soli]
MIGTIHKRKGAAMLAALCLVSSMAMAQVSDLDRRLAEIREVGRFVPEKAVGQLRQIEAGARAAPPATKGEWLNVLSLAERAIGRHDAALALADELVVLGKKHNDKVLVAKGLLSKAYVASRKNQNELAHQLIWEAERMAGGTADMPLRVEAAITSGAAYAEEGNLPAALGKLQEAVALARSHGAPIPQVMALNALASQYGRLKEYDKGFEALAEASTIAVKTNSPGRMATLKNTEYGLALETGQADRALNALLEALALQRRIGAETMIVGSLVDLSDNYLKRQDFNRAASYARQAITAANKVHSDGDEAIARINLGQAHLGRGQLAEGKREFDIGLAYFEQSGDKPELRTVLQEYGEALERAGDMAGAVAAYHRERAIADDLFKDSRQKALLELQAKYETEKKQRQIALLSRENQLKTTEIDNRRLQQRVWWLLALVFAMAAVIVGTLYRKVRSANARLEEKNQELKQQSSRDPLTGLYNRRHFQEFMRNHVHTEQRGSGTSGEEVIGAIFLLDVDHFKHVNDRHGHAAGDMVLKMISDHLRVILRETDMIVRWGGEEFLAFLPAIPRSGVDEIAARLLAGVAAQDIVYQGSTIPVRVSVGYAPFPLKPGSAELSWERAVNLVDMALYLAKAHGRNRAYGVRGFANFDKTSMENIEQDLERAWREGFVDMTVVLGDTPAPRKAAWPQADVQAEQRATIN